ncbi:aspartate--ammonia ligase [Nematocida sp. LUAm3]|nr:aspartate--ammonia ligase [Nematocida sp. LUAm3]KAI5174824.1 aspartate--ammonia ligase [Nematocida sp. LUAm2]KAI5177578.1 aspartate--ammonia ligase [Nematocida sp. LUAm1]
MTKIEKQVGIDVDLHKKALSKSMYTPEKKYMSKISGRDTERAVKEIKQVFQSELSKALGVERKACPLFVSSDSGLNDGLSGYERPVAFDFRCGVSAQIVQSLAKWKRMTLYNFGYEEGSGIYADMNAIRRDEDLSPIHSYYVDQWDWELVISKEKRTLETLKSIVEKIYASIKGVERHICSMYPSLECSLADKITFITSQELETAYPDLSPKEREDLVCKKHGSVFLMQIGKVLESGNIHDSRAPDYDDWELNGDILVHYDVLDIAFELSSMGIRVDAVSLEKQLRHCKKEDFMKFEYHQHISQSLLPFTIGGGIGKSRLCMFMLKKLHIGEIQPSIWPQEVLDLCETYGVHLL